MSSVSEPDSFLAEVYRMLDFVIKRSFRAGWPETGRERALA